MTNEDRTQLAALDERIARLKSHAEYLESLATRIAGVASCLDLGTIELTTTKLNVPGLTVVLDRIDLVLSRLVAHARDLDAELPNT